MLERDVNRLVGGMSKDESPLFQPEHSTTFVLNGIRESEKGDRGSISNEYGNKLCYSIKEGYKVIGTVVINNDDVIVFSTDNITSEIGIVRSCNYETLVNDTCLNFSTQYPMKGLFREKTNKERIIYFYDTFNPDRYINIDRIDEVIDSNGNLICDLLSFTSNYQIPDIIFNRVNETEGNNVEVGMYYFSVRYKSTNTYSTDYINTSDPIIIYRDGIGTSYENIEGGYNLSENWTVEAGGVPTTNKSINLTFNNLDENYDELEITVTKFTSGDGITSSSYIVDTLPISTDSLTWTFKGINYTDAIQVDNQNIAIDNVSYVTSKSMVEVENRLVRGNVSEKYRNWGILQQTSNNIKSEWITEASSAFEISDQNSKSPNYYYYFRGYTRDEVYAFGITYIFKDGTTSPVFHIPGRVADTDNRIDEILGNASPHHRNQLPSGSDWDTQELTIVNSGANNTTEVNVSEVEHLGLGIGATVPRWKVYNTGIKFSANRGLMSYYETEKEYPDNLDRFGNRIFPEGKIRHHKFPDATLSPIYDYNAVSINLQQYEFFNMGIKFNNIVIPEEFEDEIVGWKIVRAERLNSDKSVLEKGMYFGNYSWILIDNRLSTYEKYGRFVSQRNKIYGTLTNANNGNLNNAFVPIGHGAGNLTKCYDSDVTPAEMSPIEHDYYYSFIGPDNKFKNTYPQNSYVKYENVLTGSFATHINDNSVANTDYQSHSVEYIYGSEPFTLDSNVNITDTFNLDFNAQNTVKDLRFLNNTQQKVLMLKAQLEDWENSTNDTLREGYPKGLAPEESTGVYISIKKVNSDQYSVLENIKYVQTSNILKNTSEVDVFGGDTFISMFYDRTTFYGKRCVSGFVNDKIINRNYIAFPVESTLNVALRHGHNSDVCGNFLPRSFFESEDSLDTNDGDNNFDKTIGQTNDDRIRNMFREYYYLYNDGNSERPLCENFYGYNDDFTANTTLKYFFPLKRYYDYTAINNHKFPNRIIWSQPSFSTDDLDAYRYYLANDFKDVGLDSGEITNLFMKSSRELYVTTNDSMFRLFPGNQEVKTNVDTLYIGTGTFLSLPEVQLVKTDDGYAGNQGRFNIKSTEYGVLTSDQKNGKVYLFNDKLEPISNHGMNKWFRDNLPSQFEKQYRDYSGREYPYRDNTVDDRGIGLSSVHDPESDRLLLHKKDIYITDIEEAVSNSTINFNVESANPANSFLINSSQLRSDAIPVGKNNKVLLDTLQLTLDDIYAFDIRYPVITGGTFDASELHFEVYKNGKLFRTLVQGDVVQTMQLYFDTDFEGDGHIEYEWFYDGDLIEIYAYADVSGYTLDPIKNRLNIFINLGSETTSNIYINDTVKYKQEFRNGDEGNIISWAGGVGFSEDNTATGDMNEIARLHILTDAVYNVSTNINFGIDFLSPVFQSELRVNDVKVGSGENYNNTLSLKEGDILTIKAAGENDGVKYVTGTRITAEIENYIPPITSLPEEYIENRSWTISYNPNYGSWSSFHSYLPYYWYNDFERFYTVLNNEVWSHDNIERCKFYDNQYEHILEYIIKHPQTRAIHSLEWLSRLEEYDPNLKEWYDVINDTYNKLLVYNNKQSTGLINLNPLYAPTVDWSNDNKLVVNVDTNWRVSQLRDLVNASGATMSASWADPNYFSYFNQYGDNNGYIDKVENTAVLDYNKDLYDLAELKNKYHTIRLFFDNNQKITLDLINSINKISNR